MLPFQRVDFSFHILRGVGSGNRYVCLEYDIAFVATFAHEVNCYAGFGFSGSHHSRMNMMAIHSFAAIFWKKRRMNVYDFFLITFDNEYRHHQKKSGKYYHVDCMSVE